MSSLALTDVVERFPARGTFSVWWGPVDGPPWFTHDPDAVHYAASTMKVALALAAYRRADAGTLDLDALVPVHNDFTSAVGGRFSVDQDDDSDPEPWRRLGERVALRWLALRAIVRSSNLATNLLLEAVGVDAVAETLAAVGATGSVVSRGIEDAEARLAGLQNMVTAHDLAVTLQAIATESAVSPESRRELLAVLTAQQINDAIPAGLPAGTRVAHKSGWVDGISHDAGVVFPPDSAPFVFVMCTSSDLAEDESLALVAAGAAAAWQDRKVSA